MLNVHNFFFTADRSVTGVGLSAALCSLPPAVQGHETISFVSKYNMARFRMVKAVNRHADLPMRFASHFLTLFPYLSSFHRLAENKTRKVFKP